MLRRRDWLWMAAAAGSGVAGLCPLSIATAAEAVPRLTPPKNGPALVAVVVGEHNVVIDFAGPWEVFEGSTLIGEMNGMQPPNMAWPKNQGFQLKMVSDRVKPLDAEGMIITPHYSFENFPAQPNVILIGEQGDPSPAKIAWIQKASQNADLVMSVCTGAFLLAKTGLLDGLSATTHHDAYDAFQSQFPNVHLKRGVRFADNGKVASSGGLSSGIELALRVVQRYYGENVSTAIAYWMEYNRSAHRPTA